MKTLGIATEVYTIFKEFIILLRLFGLEVPHAAESLEIWSSCPDGVCVQHPLNKWKR